MIGEKRKKLKLNTTASAEKYMGYSLAITAYCQTCNLSLRAKENEHRRISRTLAVSKIRLIRLSRVSARASRASSVKRTNN
ncbi:MAG: hypothetical protein ACI4MQ_02295 [Candidatus Coproplasma sp.]